MGKEFQFKLTVHLSPYNTHQTQEEAQVIIEEVLNYITHGKSKMKLHDLWDYKIESINE